MARGTKKEEASASGVQNPEATARKRLKRLAFSNNILSENQAKSSVHLTPSKTVLKHHGKDILKKSQRKNRFLFSFPGLIAPISGGKIGELKDLGTKNPILYLDFPQGQMKLFGTIVYPKNRYLTLQFSRGGKNVMCEDYFDNMIVFSDAWWIGKKDENPEEARLEIPMELYEGQQADCDFKGGAGASSVISQNVIKRRIQHVEDDSPKTPTEDDLSGSENNKDTKEVVSVRHSERTAGKTYKYAESYSGDDSDKSSPVLSEHEEKVVEVDTAAEDCNSVEKKNRYSVVVDISNDDAVEGSQLPKENKACASGSKSKKLSQRASATVNKENSSNKRGSLVQATLSTLFKKVEEKKAPRNQKKSPSSKVSGQKSQRKGSKRKIDLVDDDDDIEGISSAPENTDGSDGDWAA